MSQDIEMRPVEELPLRNQSDQEWRIIFQTYDRNNDGRICFAELRNIINAGECGRNIPDHVVRQIMRRADQDSSGYLEIDEFITMVNLPEFKHHFRHLFQKYIKMVVPRRSGGGHGVYEQEYSCWPPAVCMLIISIVELILFLIDAFIGHVDTTGPIAIKLIYHPHRRYEAWRYFTYMFVHLGTSHLVVNFVIQLLLGIPLEMVHKWWRVLTIYLAGVVAGSLGKSFTNPGDYLAGASGGVYALITAHLATLFLNWSEIEYAGIQLIIFMCIVGTDLGISINNRYFSNMEHNVSYVAHFAGAIAGLLVGIGILRNLEIKSWENKLWWCAVVLYCLLMTIAIFMNIFWTDHFPPSI